MWVLNPSKQGNFHFRFDTATQQGERIYCVEANMKFDYRDDRRDGQTSDLVIEQISTIKRNLSDGECHW